MLSMQDVKKDADALKSVKKLKPIDGVVLVLSDPHYLFCHVRLYE